ncbi:hypothetical protein OPV22_008723 [Ensete ventricosum]|uniref:SMP domain-containing protein n=1 Tax=Ensete ventricosum TaxID=4639 RepID=A0AAV8RDF2_ENSVE|nr:hypothetical protein OPV22_008723 [Ensete ventricosum]
MASVKETAENVAASATSGMDKTKATVQEKGSSSSASFLRFFSAWLLRICFPSPGLQVSPVSCSWIRTLCVPRGYSNWSLFFPGFSYATIGRQSNRCHGEVPSR